MNLKDLNLVNLMSSESNLLEFGLLKFYKSNMLISGGSSALESGEFDVLESIIVYKNLVNKVKLEFGESNVWESGE